MKSNDEQLEGKTIAEKYRIQEVIGRGGMGIVYRAEDTKLERNVALKFLPPELKIDEEARKRFVLEAKSAAALSHPNICTIHEIGEDDGHSFIAMEYVEGKSLREWLKERPLTLDDVVDVGIQVAEGLDEAHQKGIIHRDIKSANIMVTERGQAKIMDFGLAKMSGGIQITQEARTMGTVAYMSPEQTKGNEIDHRTDIWSLGIVLYELAVGYLPFRGDRDETILFSIRNDEPKPVEAILQDAPPAFVQIIKNCLAKDPNDRYQNAGELVQDLRSLRRDTKSLITKPRSVMSRMGGRTLKIRLAWLISTAVILSVTAFAYFFIFLSSPNTSLAEPRLLLVAVAPFENQTGDPTLDRLSVEVTELIESGLSQSGLVAVLENSELVLSGEEESLSSLARNKGVVKLISGAYFLQGESIRFTSKLLDTHKGEVDLAVDPASGTVEAPYQAMQTIHQSILGGLAATLDPNFSDQIGKWIAPSYDAWREYAAARAAESKRDYAKAQEHYHNAWELDGSFYNARYREGRLYFSPAIPREFRDIKKAEVIFRELNESRDKLDPLSRAKLDWALARINHNWEWCYQALKEMERYSPSVGLSFITAAVRTNRPREALEALKRPDTRQSTRGNEWNLIMAWQMAYLKIGKPKKALKEVQKGRALYPDAQQIIRFEIECLAILGRIKEMNQCWNLFKNKEYMARQMIGISRLLAFYDHEKAAQDLAERAVAWHQNRIDSQEAPKQLQHRFELALALYTAGRINEAENAFDKFVTEFPGQYWAYAYLGFIAAQRGEREKAKQISDDIEKSGFSPMDNSFIRANIACQLGDFEEALALLKIALENGNGHLFVWETYGHVLLKPMLDYPPFKKFMEPKG